MDKTTENSPNAFTDFSSLLNFYHVKKHVILEIPDKN